MAPHRRVLFVGEERQQDFPFFPNKVEERSARVLFSFFEIGVSDNDRSNGCILNLRVGLCHGHSINVEEGLRSLRAINPVDRHASNSGFAT